MFTMRTRSPPESRTSPSPSGSSPRATSGPTCPRPVPDPGTGPIRGVSLPGPSPLPRFVADIEPTTQQAPGSTIRVRPSPLLLIPRLRQSGAQHRYPCLRCCADRHQRCAQGRPRAAAVLPAACLALPRRRWGDASLSSVVSDDVAQKGTQRVCTCGPTPAADGRRGPSRASPFGSKAVAWPGTLRWVLGGRPAMRPSSRSYRGWLIGPGSGHDQHVQEGPRETENRCVLLRERPWL